MHAHLTWQPADTDDPHTLTVDLPAERITEMQALIGTPAWRASEAAVWIDYRSGDEGPMAPGLFRLARVLSIEPLDPSDGPAGQ
jgi:hypothetical protein